MSEGLPWDVLPSAPQRCAVRAANLNDCAGVSMSCETEQPGTLFGSPLPAADWPSNHVLDEGKRPGPQHYRVLTESAAKLDPTWAGAACMKDADATITRRCCSCPLSTLRCLDVLRARSTFSWADLSDVTLSPSSDQSLPCPSVSGSWDQGSGSATGSEILAPSPAECEVGDGTQQTAAGASRSIIGRLEGRAALDALERV